MGWPYDNLAAMFCECRWLPIGLALSFTALACSRTPMDEPHGVTTNTISSGGGAGTVDGQDFHGARVDHDVQGNGVNRKVLP